MKEKFLSKLKHNLVVEARLGLYIPNKTEPEWEDWKDYTLFIQNRTNGEIATLALQERLEWAEYSCESFCEPSKHHPDGVFLVEEYYLEIKLKNEINN